MGHGCIFFSDQTLHITFTLHICFTFIKKVGHALQHHIMVEPMLRYLYVLVLISIFRYINFQFYNTAKVSFEQKDYYSLIFKTCCLRQLLYKEKLVSHFDGKMITLLLRKLCISGFYICIVQHSRPEKFKKKSSPKNS